MHSSGGTRAATGTAHVGKSGAGMAATPDLEVKNAAGETLPVWPCPLCMLTGRTESARSHPLQRCHANPNNPECQPPIARIRAKAIVARGHPLPVCMQSLDLPHDIKSKAVANEAP